MNQDRRPCTCILCLVYTCSIWFDKQTEVGLCSNTQAFGAVKCRKHWSNWPIRGAGNRAVLWMVPFPHEHIWGLGQNKWFPRLYSYLGGKSAGQLSSALHQGWGEVKAINLTTAGVSAHCVGHSALQRCSAKPNPVTQRQTQPSVNPFQQVQTC